MKIKYDDKEFLALCGLIMFLTGIFVSFLNESLSQAVMISGSILFTGAFICEYIEHIK